jgi:hypothetical protein
MQLFSGLRGKRLTPAWEHTVRGVLWRLFPSAGGLLVGEDRDLEKKTVSFFCLDDRTGAVRWKDLTFPEPWWISMEALHAGTLILHEFAAPDMPDHKKIYAVDAATGRIAWSNDDVKFLFAHGEHVYAAKETFEERLFSEYRLADGAFVRGVESGEIREIQRAQGLAARDVVDFPQVPRPGEQGDPDLPQALAAAAMDAAEDGLIEFVPAAGHLVVAGCLPEPRGGDGTQSFVQKLFVYDRARRRVVFDDVMHARLSMPVPDMLFRRDGIIYYIKERHSLRAVRLAETGER